MRSLLLSILILLAADVCADTVTDLMRGCAAIDNNDERLRCYDAINQILDQSAEQSFGQEDERAAEIVEAMPDSLGAIVTEIREGADAKIIVTLENGQIWRQTDVNRVFWEPGEEVEITRGLFGSFFMKSVDGGRKIRVSRAN